MCTFILAWQVFPEVPVVVAANRDESLDRPSRPPAYEGADPEVLAPRDLEAGGTWIGVNGHGVLAAVTNRWLDRDLPAERSRGLLVDDALEASSAEDAARTVERTVEADAYDGFNLVVADAEAAVLLEFDGALSVRTLAPGVHVVVNVGADDRFVVPGGREDVGRAQAEAARRARATLRPEPGEDAASWLERASVVLRDHEYGFCVHGDGFGTRSSSLVTVDADGVVDYRFADGPPCEVEHVPVDGQV